MDINGYSAHVLVNGRKVKEYRHNGLTFIEAKDGTEFTVEVKNHQYQRILAIVSVDGIDVVDGKPATEKSRGYIVNGNSADVIKGWRVSDTEIGAFKFVTSDKSYATEKGRGQNNGIIAVKLIAEKVKEFQPTIAFPKYPTPLPRPRRNYFPTPYYSVDHTGNYGGVLRDDVPMMMNQGEYVMSKDAVRGRGMSCGLAPASAHYSATVTDLVSEGAIEGAAAFDMGTTWGSKLEDRVTTTEFEYGVELGTLEFYYASREALKAMGVPLINERQVVKLPQAFETSYAQPPKNWRA